MSTTNTCQPQCRSAVLNVYQNKLGRSLLRSDVSCIPSREELRKCHFLPEAPIVHCSLAKLACEANLQCNAQWGAFVSECEAESARGECSARCHGLLVATKATPQGQALDSCTCTEREDQLCIHLRDNILGSCSKPTPPPPSPGDNSITMPSNEDVPASAGTTLTLFLLCIPFFLQILLAL
ncbi:GDNF/GAS1 domain protein [Dictyocaulus viviparus]|uniref:GDNF/GAS1 domain protein n=1 Tax=Dictyocaulus viviparus TaxID=29172 RepID=A0A0D8Y3N6_DICVI|nr:GDNF/GAS1 domain protein [Dictyocaulus viviparus]